jgi:hypothetical protein
MHACQAAAASQFAEAQRAVSGLLHSIPAHHLSCTVPVLRLQDPLMNHCCGSLQ